LKFSFPEIFDYEQPLKPIPSFAQTAKDGPPSMTWSALSRHT
jgi:hypothetical protein